MRILFILFLFFCTSVSLAQHIDIYGQVTDADGEPMSGATINYQPKSGTVTDSNGNFHIETTAKNSIKLKIRFIGYKTVDTLLTLDNATEVFLQITMSPDLQELPNIEISAKYQNIFDNYRSHIIDFTISKNIFYLIVKKGQKTFLCKANLNGTILEEHKLENSYNRFYNSCMGGVILVGSEWCAELHNLDDKLFITNEFSIDHFNKYIVPCKLKRNETLLFKNISKHNKKIDYFKFEQDRNPIIFYTVHDKKGEMVSQSYYRELLGAYYRETENVSINDIDYGFERQNIIDDGAWNGDLQDLIITNITHRLVLQYQALGLQEVESDLFVVDGTIYILDVLNKQIVQVREDLEYAYPIDIFDLDDIKIISDNKTSTYFQIDDDLYAVQIEANKMQLELVKELEHCYFNERKLLHEGILYRLGRKSINTVRKNIFRDSLN